MLLLHEHFRYYHLHQILVFQQQQFIVLICRLILFQEIFGSVSAAMSEWSRCGLIIIFLLKQLIFVGNCFSVLKNEWEWINISPIQAAASITKYCGSHEVSQCQEKAPTRALSLLKDHYRFHNFNVLRHYVKRKQAFKHGK